MFKTKNLSKKVILYAGDLVLITCALYLSVWIRALHFVNVVDSYTGATVFSIVFYTLSFYTFGLYNLNNVFRSTAFLTRFLVALFLGTALISMTYYLLPSWRSATRTIFLMNMIFSGAFTFLWRLAFQNYFSLQWKPLRVVIVGAGISGKTIVEILKHNKGFEVLGFVDDDVEKHNKKIGATSVLGSSKGLLQLAADKQIDAVVVAITHEKKTDLLRNLLEVKLKGIEIYDMPAVYEEITGKIPVAHLREGWVVYAPFSGLGNNMYINVKRYIDVVVSVIGLIIGFPIMLIIAIWIKFDSPGHVLFRQKRVGLNDKIYTIRKFRSMVTNAEENGAVWAKEHDSRVTRLGRFLRKTRLDELPQLWNVLAGDMSFIGPRPERPEFVCDLKKEIPFYSLRHTIKPGLTGWAQVNFKYSASKEDTMEKIQYDLFYLKNLSFLLDLQIVLKTINVVMFREGAR
jgi:sugar transferase (PEP-CTERM system associated)